MIALLAECQDIVFMEWLKGHKFKDSSLNNHRRRVAESTEAIRVGLRKYADVEDREDFTYEYAAHMVNLMRHLMNHTAEDLRDVTEFLEERRKLRSIPTDTQVLEIDTLAECVRDARTKEEVISREKLLNYTAYNVSNDHIAGEGELKWDFDPEVKLRNNLEQIVKLYLDENTGRARRESGDNNSL